MGMLGNGRIWRRFLQVSTLMHTHGIAVNYLVLIIIKKHSRLVLYTEYGKLLLCEWMNELESFFKGRPLRRLAASCIQSELGRIRPGKWGVRVVPSIMGDVVPWWFEIYFLITRVLEVSISSLADCIITEGAVTLYRMHIFLRKAHAMLNATMRCEIQNFLQ